MTITGMPYVPYGSVGESLLEGCIDLHVHASPEIVPGPVDDVSTAKLAVEMGMKALALKPFLWPTMGVARTVSQFVEGIGLYGGIILNSNMGGICPWIVESAARSGAKVVWMPTWNALNDLKREGFSRTFMKYVPGIEAEKERGLKATDASGELTTAVKEIIRLCKEYDLVLCTGHLAPHDSRCIAVEAAEIGFKKVVFSHPLSRSVGASIEEMQDMADLGAYIEHTAILTFPMLQHVRVDEIREAVSQVGAEQTLLTSDVAFPYNPPGPIMMQMFLASLKELGLSQDALRQMACENPAYLLGL